ncbi:MAG TPA: metallophosphoesterase [Bacilli bacterium]|nr:metallophosphoesterase [Bacilli bacterium]
MRDFVRIIQAGDLHLGTAFSGSGFPVAKAKQRRRELLATFRRLCDTAVERDVDAMLLVGDLFEAEWVSQAEVAEVRHLLGEFGRPVFISPGNHDCLEAGGPYDWGDWPANVHIFGPEVSSISLADVRLTVHGFGYGSRWVKQNPFQGYRVPEDDFFQVVMIHGSYDAPEGTPYLPITKSEVEALGADYVAFGHYHQPQVLLGEERLLQAAYAGSLEPLGYDERDEHGAFLLDVTKGGARVEWLDVAERMYRRVEVDLTGCTSMLEAAEKVKEQIPLERKGRDLLDVVFVGTVDPSFLLDADDLQDRVKEYVFHLRMQDHTEPDIDGDAYFPQSAPGRFAAKMRARLEEATDERQRRILERALALGLTAYERGKVVRG